MFGAVDAAMGNEENDVIDGIGNGIGRGQPPRVATPGTEAPARATELRPPAGVRAAVTQGIGAGVARELAAGPPVDAAKVARLRDAIVGGDYRADPQAIAAAMLALETPPKA